MYTEEQPTGITDRLSSAKLFPLLRILPILRLRSWNICTDGALLVSSFIACPGTAGNSGPLVRCKLARPLRRPLGETPGMLARHLSLGFFIHRATGHRFPLTNGRFLARHSFRFDANACEATNQTSPTTTATVTRFPNVHFPAQRPMKERKRQDAPLIEFRTGE